MSDGSWGIMIQYAFGRYNTFLAADPFIYERVKDGQDQGMHFVAGRQGVLSGDIDRVARGFSTLVKRLNNSEQLDIKIELETIVNDAEIAEVLPKPIPT